MSKKLEELLDLPDSKEIIKQEKDKEKHEVIQQQNDTLRDIAEMDKISSRLKNKDFVKRAPKHIVDQEKSNYNNLGNDIKKLSATVKSL